MKLFPERRVELRQLALVVVVDARDVQVVEVRRIVDRVGDVSGLVVDVRGVDRARPGRHL